MFSIDFNTLPQITKTRFLDATGRPIARYPSSAASSTSSGCLLVLGLLVLLPVVAVLLSTAAKSGKMDDGALVFAFAFVALFTLLTVLGGLGIAHSGALTKAHPYVLAKYVFPTQIVVAESKLLDIYPLSELIDVTIVNHYYNGSYTSSTVTCTFSAGPAMQLTASSIQEARRVGEALLEGKRTMLLALARGDYETLRAIDPLFEAQMTQFAKVNEPGPMVQALPKWTEMSTRLLISFGSAVAFAGLVLLVRVIIVAVAPDPAPVKRYSPPSMPTVTKKPSTR